jgi:uncharacterized protein YndB with AHSA1/START domain
MSDYVLDRPADIYCCGLAAVYVRPLEHTRPPIELREGIRQFTTIKDVLIIGVINMTDRVIEPVAKAQMLIRKPVAEVFEAMIDPAITSQFWFSKSNARLEPGKQLRWDWEMYGVFTNVEVKAIDKDKRILIEWNRPDNPSFVEWTFEPKGADRTFVVIKNWGFKGESEKVLAEALDSTGGFSFLLADLKAFLEHGIKLNLVPDHAPDQLVKDVSARPRA